MTDLEGALAMKLKQLLAELMKLKLDTEMEVCIQVDGAVFTEFDVLIGTHEHSDGGLIDAPDPEGWGDLAPRELPEPILTLCSLGYNKRKPKMF